MDDSFFIHDLPAGERLRERLKATPTDNRSSAEILAVLIGRDIPGQSAVLIANERTAGNGVHEFQREGHTADDKY